MLAYTQGITKKQFVNEIISHQLADNFIRGTYYDGEKGCAVGCSLKSVAKLKNIDIRFDDHNLYEEYLGIPEWLARLEDCIFEAVLIARSKLWPREFSEAINEGADLEAVKLPFICYILEHNIEVQKKNLDDNKDNKEVVKVIKKAIKVNKDMIKALKEGDEDKIKAASWSASWSAAFEKFADKLLELLRECK